MSEQERNPESELEEAERKGMVVDDSQPVSLSELITTTPPPQPESKKP